MPVKFLCDGCVASNEGVAWRLLSKKPGVWIGRLLEYAGYTKLSRSCQVTSPRSKQFSGERRLAPHRIKQAQAEEL